MAASCAENNTNYENEKDVNDPHVILSSSNNIDNLDVGNYLSNTSISDQEKFKILNKPWTPGNDFNFPKCGKRNLKFQLQWLKSFQLLVYSQAGDQGALCKYCVCFL